MKLLYAYIESFGELFQDEEFIFSNEFIISYSKSNQMLTINKNVNYLNKFYGEIISDITAIVGKNGVGKTTLLNLIGRSFKDRLELSNINEKREISDGYFLIYHVTDNIFYVEGGGKNFIKNIESNINAKNSKFYSFYFEDNNCNYKIIKYENKVREKILYVNSEYVRSTEDLITARIGNEEERIFLPRISGDNLSLVDWYLVYIDLCKQNMVSSEEITILFHKNDNIKYEKDFIIQPSVKKCTYNIDRIIYTEENIEDFYSHLMSCIVGYYIKLSGKICKEEGYRENLRKLRDKYEDKTIFSRLEYKSIFEECETIIKSNRLAYRYDEVEILIKFIEHVNKLFFALYNIKQYIIPGINEFKLKLSGINKSDEIEEFFHIFTELKEFINNTFGLNDEKEDAQDYKDDYSHKYYGNDLVVDMPFDIYRVNISTGEKNLIGLLSTIMNELKSFSGLQSFSMSHQDKTYIILVDEIELGMHLDWSRNLINFIIEYVKNQVLNIGGRSLTCIDLKIKIQLIITTHSPFLLSDLNRNSIIALDLENGKAVKKKGISAFAQNIQRIMNNEFFIHDCYGAFAQNKIQNVIKRLNSEKELTDDEKETIRLIIEEVGEPLLKNKLNEKYNDKLIGENSDNFEERRLINKLKEIYGNLDDKELIERLKTILKKP